MLRREMQYDDKRRMGWNGMGMGGALGGWTIKKRRRGPKAPPEICLYGYYPYFLRRRAQQSLDELVPCLHGLVRVVASDEDAVASVCLHDHGARVEARVEARVLAEDLRSHGVDVLASHDDQGRDAAFALLSSTTRGVVAVSSLTGVVALSHARRRSQVRRLRSRCIRFRPVTVQVCVDVRYGDVRDVRRLPDSIRSLPCSSLWMTVVLPGPTTNCSLSTASPGSGRVS